MRAFPNCEKQAERFFILMHSMDSPTRKVFLTIYQMAPKGVDKARNPFRGDHVRLAMMESLLHPGIAYWVRMNLSIRVARKLAQTTGRHEQVEKLNGLLEAFHVAADAFALNLPLTVALARRMEKAGQVTPPPAIPIAGVSGVSAEEVDLIQTFKSRIIPGLVRSIRRESSRTA